MIKQTLTSRWCFRLSVSKLPQRTENGVVPRIYEFNSAPPGRKTLGSTALFRESVELGYQLTPRFSISGFVDHMSNADLAPHNAGITDTGALLGFKF